MEFSVSLDPAVGKGLAEYVAELNVLDGISLHCDVMRADFVGRDSMTAAEFEAVMRATRHPVDVHIMARLESAEDIVESVNRFKPRSVCFHVECVGGEFDPAVDLDTPIDAAFDADIIAEGCEVVTVMSVKAGKSGQVFNPAALEKVRQVRELFPCARIILDGGINAENAAQVAAAGADTAVVGSYMFNSPDRKYALEKIRRAIGAKNAGQAKQ